MNYCPDGGFVIADEGRASNDPIDYDVVGLPIFGCHRLRCGKCHEIVRSARALDFRSSQRDVDLVSLHQLPDLEKSALLHQRPGVRLYLCRCMRWLEVIGQRPVEGEGNDPFHTPQVPWACDGHPLADLPHHFDGEEVTPENLAHATAKSLRGMPPPGAAPEDTRGGIWAARLYARLAGTRWQASVAAAVSPLLRDLDSAVRARALQVFFLVRPPRAADEAVALLAGERRLYAGVPDDVTTMDDDETQEHTLWNIASPLVAKPGLARDLARADALAPGKGSSAVYLALAGGDPEWVAEHVEDIARVNPTTVEVLAEAILYRFPEDMASEPVIARLGVSPEDMG